MSKAVLKNQRQQRQGLVPCCPAPRPAAGSRAGQNQGLPPLCLATAPQGTERWSHGHGCYAHPLLVRMHISALLKCLLLWPLPLLTYRHTSKLSPGGGTPFCLPAIRYSLSSGGCSQQPNTWLGWIKRS